MKRILTLFAVFIAFATIAFASIPERPTPPRLVNDFASALSSNQVSEIENALVQFAKETSTQIVLVIVPDLEGYEKADYAYQIGEKWGVGQKGKDNGIVMLLKPKTLSSRGEVFIATGYGLEGVLPDAIVNTTVVNKEMIPRFKQGDYYGGLAAGLNVIMAITRGEYTAENYQEKTNAGGGAPIFFILLFVFFLILLARSRRKRFYSPGDDLPFWLAMSMLSGRRRSSGSFDDFSSGSGGFGGGFGGSSGGGFGGFGGGSFGGGGAGGSW